VPCQQSSVQLICLREELEPLLNFSFWGIICSLQPEGVNPGSSRESSGGSEFINQEAKGLALLLIACTPVGRVRMIQSRLGMCTYHFLQTIYSPSALESIGRTHLEISSHTYSISIIILGSCLYIWSRGWLFLSAPLSLDGPCFRLSACRRCQVRKVHPAIS
jgi:hypothetical protein